MGVLQKVHLSVWQTGGHSQQPGVMSIVCGVSSENITSNLYGRLLTVQFWKWNGIALLLRFFSEAMTFSKTENLSGWYYEHSFLFFFQVT